MRGGLKPKCRKLKRFDGQCINQKYYPPAVYGIPGQPVGMPGDYSVRFSSFNPRQHSIKDWPARALGRLRFSQHGNDIKAIPQGKFFQFRLLGFQR
ncbi:MAG: hypothetical protein PHE24_06280 [Patescibacteria group bacterium]|nr:hypothetical protein [Patescibacteria group bacterium]